MQQSKSNNHFSTKNIEDERHFLVSDVTVMIILLVSRHSRTLSYKVIKIHSEYDFFHIFNHFSDALLFQFKIKLELLAA